MISKIQARKGNGLVDLSGQEEKDSC